jgi:O-antigen/teichoic acid export membrane protein
MNERPNGAVAMAPDMQDIPLMQRLARNGAAASVLEVLVTGGFLLIAFRVVIAHSSLKQFGVWALIQSLTSVIKLADVGVAGALPKFIGQMSRKDREQRIWPYIDTSIIFTFCFYALVASIAYYPLSLALRHSLEPGQQSLGHTMLPLVLVNAILWSLSTVPIAALVGIRKGTNKSIINMTGAALLLVTAIVLAPRLQLMGLVFAQMIQFVFVIVAAWASLSRHLRAGRFRLRLHFHRDVIRETIGLSLLTQANTAMAQLYDVVVRLVLTRVGGTASTAVYELVERVFQPVRVLLIGPAFLSVPILARAFARRQLRAIGHIYERQVALITASALIVYAGVALLAPVVSLVLLRRIDQQFLLFFFIDWAATFVYVLCIPGMLFGPASGKLRYNIIGNVFQLAGSLVAGTAAGLLYGPLAALVGIACVNVASSLFQTRANTLANGAPLLPSRRLVSRLMQRGGMKLLFRPIMS